MENSIPDPTVPSPARAVVRRASFSTHPSAATIPEPAFGNCSWVTLLSQPATPTADMCAGVMICPPRTGSLSPHRHAQAEIYYILSGRGTLTVNGVEQAVEPGSAVYIPSFAEHGVVNAGEDELRWFYVFATSAFEDVKYVFSR